MRDGLEAFLRHPTVQAAPQLNGGAECALIDALWAFAPLDEIDVGDSVTKALFEQRIKETSLRRVKAVFEPSVRKPTFLCCVQNIKADLVQQRPRTHTKRHRNLLHRNDRWVPGAALYA